jgi:hypothetical protein
MLEPFGLASNSARARRFAVGQFGSAERFWTVLGRGG